MGVSESTVSGGLARAGASKLSDLQPVEPIVRYEHEATADSLHTEIKKLGRTGPRTYIQTQLIKK